MNKNLLLSLISLVCININSNLDINKMELDAKNLLAKLHSQLKLKYGSLKEEYSEQIMAAIFIKPENIVLELGGNIGRNSCIIASLLKKSENLVVLESDPKSARLLEENKKLNHLNFKIEASALSKRKLIQNGWNTIPSDKVLPGYYKVNTISYSELKKKYNKNFNILVADCEGALYFILKDDEKMIDDFKTLIVENDYNNIDHFNAVKNIFIKHGFKLVYNKILATHLPFPAKNEFYQVWQK